MNKPDWKDAPEWANWLAIDEYDEWYWYEFKPQFEDGEWLTDGRIEFAFQPACTLHLEERPK